MGTVGHDNEARFFTHQAIFDHHTCAGAADAVVPKHGVHRGMRSGLVDRGRLLLSSEGLIHEFQRYVLARLA